MKLPPALTSLVAQLVDLYPTLAKCLPAAEHDIYVLGAKEAGDEAYVRFARAGSRVAEDRGSNAHHSSDEERSSADDDVNEVGAPSRSSARQGVLPRAPGRGGVVFVDEIVASELNVVRARPLTVMEETEPSSTPGSDGVTA
ncbi:hypothetical protein KFE25_013425 [Diacronema lutheri]|uniref:Uncharacterized protein n=1 Tax=Diacronema lutheri TaxID=2081491 RepID=A0A8J5XTR7_DIALT|nr:hypothetical protein KFE25_013425 [Diacronema lutheri]|mmetsp:Transcript_14681/g.45889  ORF Transcript_14681/g.45889 Transcript_14681/m.45889 type:complete len:142 (-) Transcript_14681:471-896(-)